VLFVPHQPTHELAELVLYLLVLCFQLLHLSPLLLQPLLGLLALNLFSLVLFLQLLNLLSLPTYIRLKLLHSHRQLIDIFLERLHFLFHNFILLTYLLRHQSYLCERFWLQLWSACFQSRDQWSLLGLR
jgi:hypothetical protein